MRLTALLVVTMVAGCGGRTYVGSSTTLRQHVPVVDGPVVRIPIERERQRGYSSDCGLARVFGVGEHDCTTTSSESAGREVIGSVTIDLRSGQCRFVPGDAPIADDRPLEVRLVRDDRTFVAGGQHVVELDASGAPVATHLQPAAIRPPVHPGPWLAAVPWAVGETHDGITLTRGAAGTARALALVSIVRTISLDPDAPVVRFEDSPLVASGTLLIDVERGWRVLPTTYRATGMLRVSTETSHGHWRVEVDGDQTWIDTLNGKFAPPSISMYPVGSTGAGIVAQRTDLDAILVFDTEARAWRDLRYRACLPPNPS